MQVLIYVGSVVVLLLFGLMLTKAPIGRSPDADSANRWAALAVAAPPRPPSSGGRRRVPHDLDRPRRCTLGFHQVTGASLFQNWVLPFEALSVLLLAALVGAIVLSRKAKADAAAATTGTPAVPGSRSEREGVR